MKAIREWWHRFLPGSEPTNGTPPVSRTPDVVLMGVVKMGGNLVLVAPDARVPGVKLVGVSTDFIERYNDIVGQYAILQTELIALPKALRPRQRKAKVEDAACVGISPGEPTEP